MVYLNQGMHNGLEQPPARLPSERCQASDGRSCVHARITPNTTCRLQGLQARRPCRVLALHSALQMRMPGSEGMLRLAGRQTATMILCMQAERPVQPGCLPKLPAQAAGVIYILSAQASIWTQV